jgi:hypothetical protein
MGQRRERRRGHDGQRGRGLQRGSLDTLHLAPPLGRDQGGGARHASAREFDELSRQRGFAPQKEGARVGQVHERHGRRSSRKGARFDACAARARPQPSRPRRGLPHRRGRVFHAAKHRCARRSVPTDPARRAGALRRRNPEKRWIRGMKHEEGPKVDRSCDGSPTPAPRARVTRPDPVGRRLT